jgi:hypothetical protein
MAAMHSDKHWLMPGSSRYHALAKLLLHRNIASAAAMAIRAAVSVQASLPKAGHRLSAEK